ncbi:hypothetical protein B0H13DRAFT_1855349 [Mycena leptocephala]|nr:hypothetical protein B0H13DRAFT_1855349 [Mycena leptocephala]
MAVCGRLQNYLWGLFSCSRAFVQNAGLDPVDLKSCWAMNMNRIGDLGNAKKSTHDDLPFESQRSIKYTGIRVGGFAAISQLLYLQQPPNRAARRVRLFVFPIKLILFSSWL